MPIHLRERIFLACFTCLSACSLVSAQVLPPTELIKKGDALWAIGQLDLAQETFKEAVKVDPKSVAAWMKLGGLQLSRQEFKLCIETYQHAIGLDANNTKAWLGLGFAYLHTGKDDLSMAAFNEAIRADPSTKEKLASVMAKLGSP